MSGYLQVHQNPNAPPRADGRRYWGYPQRAQPIRLVAVHTAESIPDYRPHRDDGAENVARYLSRTSRPASYHEVGDSDSWKTLLPEQAVAFGAVGWNTPVWHWSFATQAHRWPAKPDEWSVPAVRIAADRCARVAAAHGVPPVRVTLAQAQAGAHGFVAHADLDPVRRSDPGAGFPWARFLALVEQRLRPSPPPTPEPAPEEDPMRIVHVAENGRSYIGVPGQSAAHIRSQAELRRWREEWAPGTVEIRWQTLEALTHYFPGTKP